MYNNNIHYYLLYIIRDGNTNNYKIGITKDLNKRLRGIQTGCPHELQIIKLWKHTQKQVIQKYERVLHRYYKKCGCQLETQGEWFELRPADISFLCKPNTIAEQNDTIDQVLSMM